MKLEGVYNQDDAKFYIGKRAVYLYKAHNKTKVCDLVVVLLTHLFEIPQRKLEILGSFTFVIIHYQHNVYVVITPL